MEKLYILTFALIFALLLDVFCRELPDSIHPVCWMGNWIRYSSHKALQKSGKDTGSQFFAGMCLILLGLLLFCVPLVVLQSVQREWIPFFSIAVYGLLLKPMFTLSGLIQAARQIREALQTKNLTEARRLTAWHLVSRDTSELSENQIASCVIESLAENLCDSFIAPILFFMIGGLPAIWGYRLVNTADAMIGYHTERWEYIGKFAARLDDVLNYIPARISAWLLCFCSPLIGTSLKDSFKISIQQHRRASSPNAGWTICAGAAACQVCLEKKGCYIFNEEAASPTEESIDQACHLLCITATVFIALIFLSVFINISLCSLQTVSSISY